MATVGVIGTGTIGGGFARLLAAKHTLFLYNRRKHVADQLAEETGGTSVASAEELLEEAEYIVLAIKPQNLTEFTSTHGSLFTKKHVVLSMLGGTTTEALKRSFPSTTVVRMMPNIPLFYGSGVLGVVQEEGVPEAVISFIDETFSPHGLVSWIPEGKMDALAALAGSGPGFAMLLLEGWTEAGIALGFSAAEAKRLAIHTLKGSMVWAEKSERHPADLKWQVCSPGGSTIAGVQQMEESGVRSGLVDGLFACYEKSR